MRTTAPSILIGSKTKSLQYFSELHWPAGPICPFCMNSERIYRLYDKRLKCSKCGRRFNIFSYSYLGRLYAPIEEIAHLMYLFTIGVPAFKSRLYLRVSLKTAHRAYRLFRKAIHDILLGTSVLNSLIIADNNTVTWPVYRNKILINLKEAKGSIVASPLSRTELSSVVDLIDGSRNIRELKHISRDLVVDEFMIRNGFVIIRKPIPSQTKKRSSASLQETFHHYYNNLLYQYRGIPKNYFPFYLKEAEFRFNHRNDDIFLELAKIMTRSYAPSKNRYLPIP